jgi:uncharacterized RDD family membrane protein YckC
MNPYQAPFADAELLAARASPPQRAERRVRLTNLLVDSVCRFFIWLLLPLIAPSHPRLVVAISLGWMVGYYFIFEALFQVTPGKLATGTHVVDWNGNKPSLLQILGRSLTRFIPFEPLSFFGRSPDGWHDRWSGTYVVKR